ncbi:MAG: TlpA disulfide reductase family protein [Terrimicrobiaceae bacterium]|nr:TlpA disulfide reductase family protein [Terrimicrobiaceae bacterium]
MIDRTVHALAFALLTAAGAIAADAPKDADAAWAVIEQLDKGPPNTPTSRDEALRLAHEQFAKQRAALAAFVAAYPADPRALDAKLSLTSIRAATGAMERKPAEIQGALLELMAIEKSKDVPRARLPDVAFRRISLQMQTLDGSEAEIREAVVTAARNYAARFPEDKRAPRLLVEAATQCDDDPRTMRALLTSAQTLSREPALNARIADDMRRLESLGRPVNAKFQTIQGRMIDLAALRGSVVVLLFWAAESPPSLLWMQQFRTALAKIPQENLRIVMVSLDEDRKDLDEAMRAYDITWPTHFDGKGWENAVARPLGINAIPTVWLLDKRGNLRTLNARESYDTWIRRLQRER